MSLSVPLLMALSLAVTAPPALEPIAARIRAIDVDALSRTLASAGLEMPRAVEVRLVSEGEPLARDTPAWVVGRAFGDRQIVMFPARVTRYPYDSLESVMQHEIVHLALFARAGGKPLPRWFHEGVATSVEAGWGITDQARLLFAALRGPSIADVSDLFRSDAQPDTTLAYLLAAALVNDLRERHGPDVAGRIARRVEAGAPFERAFLRETRETPDAAAARAWAAYRRWTNWMPAVANASTVWSVIVVLALLAYVAQRRRRARLRKKWEEEESWPFDS